MNVGGAVPGASDADHQLVLVNAVAVLVALEFLTILEDETRHVISGDTALLDMLASGIEACIRGLREAGLEWEKVI